MNTIGKQNGFSMIELMVSIAIGLILLIGLVQIVVMNQSKYAATTSQGETQNAELALQNIFGPALRGAGFFGCSSNTTAKFVASANSMMNSSAYLQGYDGGASATISTLNYANDTSLSDWSPSLFAGLSGQAEKNSDVLIVVGSRAGAAPAMLTADAASGSSSLSVQNASQLVSNGYIGISNCQQSSIVQSASATLASGSVTISLSSNINQAYAQGAQIVPVAATAFFIGKASGTQSALYQAENTNGTWTITPLLPGIDNMRVRYGIGSQFNTTQYKTASQMATTDWANVNSVQTAFLLEGGLGSAPPSKSGCTNSNWTLLDRTVTLPCDTRIRHVFNLTVSLRNAEL